MEISGGPDLDRGPPVDVDWCKGSGHVSHGSVGFTVFGSVLYMFVLPL